MALKKGASAGRLGPRYGRKIRQKIIDIEKIQKAKHKCPFCLHFAVKRIASGIWFCRKCVKKFAGKAYEPG